MLITLMAVAMIGQVQAPAKAPDMSAAPKVEMVPDQDWEPKPGDTAQLYSPRKEDVFAAFDLFSFTDLVKFIKANDQNGVDEMIAKRRLTLVEKGASVLVIERHANAFLAGGIPALEVRMLEGRRKGEKVWVLESSVARLIPKEAEKSVLKEAEKSALQQANEAAAAKAEKAAAAKAALDKARPGRAATLLSSARSLEKASKPKPALENYRRIVADFGDTPSAKEAAERIKVLEKR